MLLPDRSLARPLLAWYDQHCRELPWRTAAGQSCHPYYTLLSEFMLQQTQVATVLPYFHAFLRRFATLPDLARASEQQVLQLWQGLGYYSRARNLLATARAIVAEHNGVVPADVPSLLKLPGIGRYSAGAIASIAYDTRAPIVDGNVARVLCRLDLITESPKERLVQQRLWQRAQAILPKSRCGDFNSALMELGATVCTPRTPKCMICPVRKFCAAFERGMQDQIPPPRKAAPTPLVIRHTYCLHRGHGRASQWLIEQRPPTGRWAGMWQFLTLPESAKTCDLAAVANVTSATPQPLGVIEHSLSHRRYRFDVYLCHLCGPSREKRAAANRRWVRLDQLHRYPLPRPHARIAELLRQRIRKAGGDASPRP